MIDAMVVVALVLMQEVVVVVLAKEVVIKAVRVGLGMLPAVSVVGDGVRVRW